MKPVALVTGATGFLGAPLARALDRRGFALHALARADGDRSALDGLDVAWHAGDLRDASSVERAVAAACGAGPRPRVVHAGAVISYREGDLALQQAVNVGGTRALLDACRRHPVGRVLHVSSVVAVGPSWDGRVLDERSPYEGDRARCDYMTTKRRAEELALAAARELDVVVACPGAIFGASARGSNSQRVLRMIVEGRTGPLPFLLAPPGEQSVVGLDDCAEGCALVLERGRRGERYLLVESTWSHRDLAALVAGKCGRRAPVAVPRLAWSALERAAALFGGLVKSEFFTPQTIRMAALCFRASGARARRELGWDPAPFERVVEGILAAPGFRARA